MLQQLKAIVQDYRFMIALTIIVIINTIMIRIVNNKLNDKEHMTPGSCSSADMQAIANLNSLAEEIQKNDGTLTLPSNVIIDGNLTLKGDLDFSSAGIAFYQSTNGTDPTSLDIASNGSVAGKKSTRIVKYYTSDTSTQPPYSVIEGDMSATGNAWIGYGKLGTFSGQGIYYVGKNAKNQENYTNKAGISMTASLMGANCIAHC